MPITSKVQVANLALGLLGEQTITLFSDSSSEARAISLHYDSVKEDLLERHRWSRAKDTALLTPSSTAPINGFLYKFLLPSGHIKTLAVLNSLGVPIVSGWDIEGDYLFTNFLDPTISFIKDIDVYKFSPLMVSALKCGLAAAISIPLGEVRLSSNLEAKYETALSKAWVSDARQNRSGENSNMNTQQQHNNSVTNARYTGEFPTI